MQFLGDTMNNYFENIVANALLKCEGYYTLDDESRGDFSTVYPFTTENIAGYIEYFDLNRKSLLTVGSSGDQVINASLFNCKNQTVVDICPYTKYYFYLKKAAIMSFGYEEFLEFFCYFDYPKYCKKNNNVLSKNKYEKIKPLLRLLDFESFLFWDELFSLNESIDIRKNLFISDEERFITLQKMNLYMRDESLFDKVKKTIRDVQPNFIIGDIFDIKIDDVYDNIFLSNLAKYYEIEEFKLLIDKISCNLNDDGRMLLCYLYNTNINSRYQNGFASIYDLEKVYLLLGNYITSMETFCGIRGIIFGDDNIDRDSMLVYKKKINI